MDLNSILGGTTKKNGNSRPINIEQNEIGNTTAKDTPKRQPTQTKPVKRGEYSSSVSTSNPVYNYEHANNVEFSCDRIDNQSNETTGTLSVICWISEKRRDNNEWANDNVLLIGKHELGVLEKGYGFPNVSCNFEVDEETSEFIDKLSEDGDEWHFVFTINELHEDGNNYIIHTINGPNENEEIRLPISDDSVTIVKDQDGNTLVYVDGEEFTGTLYSSDERFEIEIKKSVASIVWCLHKNCLAIASTMNDDATPIYYDEQNIEIDEETFRKKYGKEFDKIIAAGFEEIDSRIANNSVYNNLSSYDGDVSVSSRIKTIVAETLNVSPYDVVENASFTNDLGADSLDAVELIMRFEKEFGLNIPDEVAERIQTVGDAIIYIGRHYR